MQLFRLYLQNRCLHLILLGPFYSFRLKSIQYGDKFPISCTYDLQFATKGTPFSAKGTPFQKIQGLDFQKWNSSVNKVSRNYAMTMLFNKD